MTKATALDVLVSSQSGNALEEPHPTFLSQLAPTAFTTADLPSDPDPPSDTPTQKTVERHYRWQTTGNRSSG